MPSPNNDDGSLTVYLVQAAGGEFDGNIQGDAYFIFIFSPLGYLRIHNLSLREKNTTTTTTTITTATTTTITNTTTTYYYYPFNELIF